MWALNFCVMVLMVLFAAVQYNDPDGPLWVAIYVVPAFWAGLAAFKIDQAAQGIWFSILCICFAGQLAVMIYYWPTTASFWRQEIWWETETAREGMGAMIAVAAIAIPFASVWNLRRRHQP